MRLLQILSLLSHAFVGILILLLPLEFKFAEILMFPEKIEVLTSRVDRVVEDVGLATIAIICRYLVNNTIFEGFLVRFCVRQT